MCRQEHEAGRPRGSSRTRRAGRAARPRAATDACRRGRTTAGRARSRRSAGRGAPRGRRTTPRRRRATGSGRSARPESSAFRRAQAIAVRAASTWTTAAPARAAASVSRPVCANRFRIVGALGTGRPQALHDLPVQPRQVRRVLRIQPEAAGGRGSELHRQPGGLDRPWRRQPVAICIGATHGPAILRVEAQVGGPPGGEVPTPRPRDRRRTVDHAGAEALQAPALAGVEQLDASVRCLALVRHRAIMTGPRGSDGARAVRRSRLPPKEVRRWTSSASTSAPR